MGQIRFRDASLDDLALLRHWAAQPHVRQSNPNDDWDWEARLPRKVAWRWQLIAELDGRPIGYVEIVDPARDDDQYWGPCPEDLRAIDIWIGEAADLGRGFGSEMLRLALKQSFDAPEVEAVLVGPLESNVRARRFFERNRFLFVEHRRFGQDDCAVYRLDRARWMRG